MKKMLAFITLVMISLVCSAQSGEVYLSVAIPQNSILDSNAKTILKNKLLTAATSQGVAATECSAIAMVPEVSILSEDKVEGGMRTIYTRQVCITLTVRNIITNTVFNSIQFETNGEGYTINDAMRSAVTKINMANERYASFVNDAKNKIKDYYNNNTSSLIRKANTLASQQQYDEALALLSTYPESLNEYPLISKTITDIFRKSQSKYCGELMQAARAAYSQRDFVSASDIAAMINPQSSCSSEAKQLLAQIKRDSDKEYNNQVEIERERYRTEAALERERIRSNERVRTTSIKAVRDIATAYYKRQTRYVWFW